MKRVIRVNQRVELKRRKKEKCNKFKVGLRKMIIMERTGLSFLTMIIMILTMVVTMVIQRRRLQNPKIHKKLTLMITI